MKAPIDAVAVVNLDAPVLSRPRFVAAHTRSLADNGGVITYDVPKQKSGLIPQAFVQQLQAIGQAMKGQQR